MDVLKAQLARMQEQLGHLTASQRMLAFSLVAVMLLTLLFWGRYAGTSEMEAILSQSLKADEIARITSAIRAKGIDYKVVGEQVMVPTDRKMEVLAELSYSQLVPQNTRETYDQLINKISPWDSDASSSAKRNDAKAALLTQVIRQWPGVAGAEVIIDPTNERRLSGARQPTASVQIRLRDGAGKPEKSLVQAAAATVAGAQSGLAMSRVTVVVNGVTYPVHDRDASGALAGDDLLSAQQEAERFYSQKLAEHLSFINGVLVSVTVDIEGKSVHSTSEEFDPAKVAQKEASTDSETTEETAPAAAGGEPGVSANTGLSIAGQPTTPGGGQNSTKERTQTKFENRFSKSTTETVSAAGKARAVGAAVRVPRSFFVNAAKAGNSSARDPDEATLAAVIQRESDGIRRDVKFLTDIKDDQSISVEPYTDALPMLAATGESGGPSALDKGSVGIMLGSHFKEIALGVLALLSLFLVRTIVKGGAPAPVIVPPPMELKEAPMLSGGEEIAGDVGEGGTMLDGMELDETSVQAQQMVEQVSTMVKENPDGAANLVKRWLNRA